jgi:LDH2 family malate/lactate/ureidoglycolate dehydrogenase
MPVSEFTGRVDQLIRELKSSERIEGVEEIFLPGEMEWKKKAQRLKSGIPLSSFVRNDLKDLRSQLRLRHDI